MAKVQEVPGMVLLKEKYGGRFGKWVYRKDSEKIATKKRHKFVSFKYVYKR